MHPRRSSQVCLHPPPFPTSFHPPSLFVSEHEAPCLPVFFCAPFSSSSTHIVAKKSTKQNRFLTVTKFTEERGRDKTLPHEREAEVVATFGELDLNCDGNITLREFRDYHRYGELLLLLLPCIPLPHSRRTFALFFISIPCIFAGRALNGYYTSCASRGSSAEAENQNKSKRTPCLALERPTLPPPPPAPPALSAMKRK